jgi:glutamate--cysteine ligase
MVPHLVTALNGPINELEQRVLESMPAIERWFRLEWMEHTPPFYCAVDLRNAGFKLAPVDTDLYPDGFNHLNEATLPLAVQAAMAAIEKICPDAKGLLLLPREGALDSFYLANLERLLRILNLAGLNVRLGTFDPAIEAPHRIPLAEGGELTLEPVRRDRRRLKLKDFDPCTILLNGDLGSGVPRALQNLHEQWLLPPLHAAWSVRRKSRHFESYEEVAKKFAKLLGMDPWLITPLFARCGQVDFSSNTGLDCVKGHAETVIAKVRRKFKDYGIGEKPYVVVKADNGTGGRGLMTLRDPKELDVLEERTRQAMTALGPGKPISEVIIQEGVPTHERIHAAVAEPVVYMIDRYVIGGFYRVHAEAGPDENLAAPGSRYVPLGFADSVHLPRPGEKAGASAPNRFYMYGVIGRLAMLAASYELEATDPNAERYD